MEAFLGLSEASDSCVPLQYLQDLSALLSIKSFNFPFKSAIIVSVSFAIISPFSFTRMLKILFFLIGILQSAPGGQGCGRSLSIPLSFGIIEVTKKKISSKKAMSAILPAFTEGMEFLIIENV